jgi:hypothetical protein
MRAAQTSNCRYVTHAAHVHGRVAETNRETGTSLRGTAAADGDANLYCLGHFHIGEN